MEDDDRLPELLGTYRHSLDAKGRLVLPSAHRDDLRNGLVMTIGLDHCLQVFPRSEWQRVREGLRRMQLEDARARRFHRMVTANAHPDTLDRQGRITIPARLRAYAHLERDVAVVGRDTYIELWDQKAWDTYEASALDDYASTDEAFDVRIF